MSYKIHLTKDLEKDLPTLSPSDAASSFDVKPYTTNGPISSLNAPFNNNGLPAQGAIGAQTTLMLYGKGVPNYGEGIQENMLRMMEHFSSQYDPIYPLHGQVWNQNMPGTSSQLRVSNNLKHAIVVDNTSAGTAAAPEYFAISTVGMTQFEKDDILARFIKNYRIKITNSVTHKTENYTIVSDTATENTVQKTIAFKVFPQPVNANLQAEHRTSNWFVTGWEYVLQNNLPLRNNLDAGYNRVTNLADPLNPSDAATKTWSEDLITAEIAAAVALHTLSNMEDVVYPAGVPNNGDILRYNAGSSTWVSTTLDDRYLQITGTVANTSMQGNIRFNVDNDMQNGSKSYSDLSNSGGPLFTLTHLPKPVSGGDVANKAYVDQSIIDAVNASGGAISLDGLLDVSSNPTAPNELLVWTGSQWENTSYASFLAGNGVVTETGGGNLSATADLNLAKTPTMVDWELSPLSPPYGEISELATNASYVRNYFDQFDSYMQAYVTQTLTSGGGDGVVTNGSYDALTQTLTLNRASFLPDVIIPIPMSKEADADLVNVYAGDEYNLLNQKVTQGYATEEFISGDYYATTHPATDLQTLLGDYNAAIGNLAIPRRRMVFTANGNGTIYLGDTSTGLQPDQMNPQNNKLDFAYTPGFNNLSVYVNGLKQYASTHGYRIVTVTGTSQTQLWPSSKTGLGVGPYNFTINVNGQGAVTISVSGVNLATVAGVVDAINAIADAQYFNASVPNTRYAFGARLLEGSLVFTSALAGSGSSIDVTLGTLFTSMTGVAATAPGDDYNKTGSYTVSTTTYGPPTGYSPATYNYNEIGRFGTESTEIQFVSGSEPTSGAIVEVIIDREMFQERTIIY